jgi:CRISPR-associated protein (TIGR02710 family)
LERKKRALVITVGTGTRKDTYIVRPLMKSVEESAPDFLVLVATEKSRKFAEKIALDSGYDEKTSVVHLLKDPDDFQSVFLEMNGLFTSLQARGFSGADVQVDFTSGTKAMSGGAVMSATHNQCRSIKYITGTRRDGVVVDGTEKFISIRPDQVFWLRDLRLAEELICHLRFGPAEDVLKKIPDEALPADERQVFGNLRTIAQAYHAWDLFDHGNAWKKLRSLPSNLGRLEYLRPREGGLEILERLSGGKSEEHLGEAQLLDLYNNAVRRRLEERYDDAVARLYRAVELYAQCILMKKFEIDTGDVDLSRVPAALRDRFALYRDRRDDRIRIGQHKGYELLHALGNRAGIRFLEDVSLQGRLRERNQSILAHGTKPMSRNVFDQMRQSVLELFRIEFQDFAAKARDTQFPWLSRRSLTTE